MASKVDKDAGWSVSDGLPFPKMLPRAACLRLLRRCRKPLSNPEKIILFGSYAWGNPTPDSDVDLLVIVRTEEPHRERYLRVAMALRPRLFPLDLIVKTPEEVEEALRTFSPFLREILRKGVCLKESNPLDWAAKAEGDPLLPAAGWG